LRRTKNQPKLDGGCPYWKYIFYGKDIVEAASLSIKEITALKCA